MSLLTLSLLTLTLLTLTLLTITLLTLTLLTLTLLTLLRILSPPVDVLSNINKILEKLMFNRLYSFLELYNCIYELQFGFREKHSTNHALLSMVTGNKRGNG